MHTCVFSLSGSADSVSEEITVDDEKEEEFEPSEDALEHQVCQIMRKMEVMSTADRPELDVSEVERRFQTIECQVGTERCRPCPLAAKVATLRDALDGLRGSLYPNSPAAVLVAGDGFRGQPRCHQASFVHRRWRRGQEEEVHRLGRVQVRGLRAQERPSQVPDAEAPSKHLFHELSSLLTTPLLALVTLAVVRDGKVQKRPQVLCKMKPSGDSTDKLEVRQQTK